MYYIDCKSPSRELFCHFSQRTYILVGVTGVEKINRQSHNEKTEDKMDVLQEEEFGPVAASGGVRL
jgi:hypothetical protein